MPSMTVEPWRKIHDTNDFSTDGNEIDMQVICVDRAMIEKYFSLDSHLDPYQTRMLGTEVWDTVTPFQATYWKQLPTAHRVRYRSRRENVTEVLRREMSRSLEEELAHSNALVEWQIISAWRPESVNPREAQRG
jgi:hypothetical protein